jgi:inward rectifier potassium channel
MPLRTTVTRPPGTSYDFVVIDDRPFDLRDISHAVLSLSWSQTLGLLSFLYLLLNALFGLAFMWAGGVANLEPGRFAEAFFFSVQTMATIGYGAMYPQSTAAHLLVVFESLVGLVFTALATGLVFVRFSRVRGRVVFANKVCIGRTAGDTHLVVRVGNGRSNQIFDAQFRLALIQTVRPEGEPVMYRSEDLKLVRDNAPNLRRAWNLMHRIDEKSPLFGLTLEQLQAREAELHIAMTGTDETTLQVVHGRRVWEANEIAFGARPADIISEVEGKVVIDLRRFHDVTVVP